MLFRSSETNFLLCRVTNGMTRDRATPGKTVKSYLEQRGILVRYFDRDNLRDCFRVSVGRPEHTDRLIEALREMSETELKSENSKFKNRTEQSFV